MAEAAVGFLELLDQERERRQLLEEAEEYAHSLRKFVAAGWNCVQPHDIYLHNWHIDAICDHLEAVTRGEITRLQVWLPRASMKSFTVSIFWPAWEWTSKPGLRYWTASYDLRLSGRLTSLTRDLIQNPWYQQRWPVKLKKADEWFYANDEGGTRLATAPGSTALGQHGHRILIDDAINAGAADATSRAVLDATNQWFDSSVYGSMANPRESAIVNIQQRLHVNDLAEHLLELEEWEVLCLPERYEAGHPYAWRGDPRQEGDLLWPSHRGEEESNALAASLGSHRAAGQMQQRPSAREGQMLQRNWWKFYPPSYLNDENIERLPAFKSVIWSWDTSFKEKTSSDYVVGQCWGVLGGDRYLLRIIRQKMNMAGTKTAMKEGARWSRERWRHAQHRILIEKSANGIEIIEQLQREITGIVAVPVSTDKNTRAEAALPDLESGNCFLPGFQLPDLTGPDERRCPADVISFIDELAAFDNGLNDDQVDSWSQAMNWLRLHAPTPMRTSSVTKHMRARRAERSSIFGRIR